MPDRTKILIVTDSPVLPTGMAEATRLIFGGLLAKYTGCYELHQLGLFQCYAVTTPQWPVYPTMTIKNRQGKLEFSAEDKHGAKTFFRLLPKVQPDIVFAFGDPQTVLYLSLPPKDRRYKLILYINFDGLPMVPGYGDILNRADLIFTKSEFSMEVLARCMPMVEREKLGYRYSPADLERFAPVPEATRAEMRQDLFPSWMPPDAFVLGWIGRNQWRKQVWLLYKVLHYLRTGEYLVCRTCGRVSPFEWDPTRQAPVNPGGLMSLVTESRPDYGHDNCGHCGSSQVEQASPFLDLFLWCHMPEEPEEAWPLRAIEEQFGLRRDRDLYYTPEHGHKSALAPEDMPMLYRIWDCLLFLSGGEGFGLPAWEAMCAAIPVIYTNYSSHAEFLGRAQAGLPVGGILQPEPKTCIWRMVADVGQTIEAVRRLYFNRKAGRQLGENGRNFVRQFNIGTQAEAWHRTFQKLVQPCRAMNLA
ncbi:MAG TPA: glycosyltransferase [Verrucomicrobiae bacterium]|nr:glycosyltransferase [Verrucomicrobiae bacterium]